MKTLSFDDAAGAPLEVSDLDGGGKGSRWSLAPDQIEKHRPMFGADYDAAAKPIADKIAAAKGSK